MVFVLRFNFQRTEETEVRIPAARCARVVQESFRPGKQRAWRYPRERARRDPQARARGMPGARCTRSPVCDGGGNTSVVTTGPPEPPAFPHAMVLTAYSALSPATNFVLSPSLATERHAQARSGGHAFANLTPATGARTTRLHRPRQRRSSARPVTAHGPPSIGKPALRYQSRARRCRVHRIPPRVRDDHDTPLVGDGTARLLELIWVRRKRKYF
jgi:hypothetical protein